MGQNPQSGDLPHKTPAEFAPPMHGATTPPNLASGAALPIVKAAEANKPLLAELPPASLDEFTPPDGRGDLRERIGKSLKGRQR